MKQKISHEGVVDAIEAGHMTVRILQTSACAACGAKKLCRSAESREKLIDVYDAEAMSYAVGQQVVVVGLSSMGMKAVRLAFLLPLVLFVAVMFGVASVATETVAAISALATVAVYYVVLSFFRSRLQREFSFSVENNKK